VRSRIIRHAGAVVLAGLLSVALGGCRPAGAQLSFVPRPGTVYRYRIAVTSTSTTRLAGQAPTTRREVADLAAVDRVLDVDASGSTLQVDITGASVPPASYVVRLDHQAGLVSIESVNGEPPAEVAGLQVQDLVPAVVGAPPDRPLRPGDRWRLDQPVALPGLAPTRLVGSGRLVAFGVQHQRKLATTSASATIDVAPAPPLPAASATAVGLQGRETITTVVTRAVSDGAIESDTAHTLGLFEIVLPGAGSPGQTVLVTGQLSVVTESTVERIG
jgi:hypothetical protein